MTADALFGPSVSFSLYFLCIFNTKGVFLGYIDSIEKILDRGDEIGPKRRVVRCLGSW